MSDIGDIGNFENAKKLCSYLGIVPKSKESNGKKWYGKITKKGRKTTRSFLSQIIFHVINSNEAYKEFYAEKKKAKGSGKAIVAVMRKLVVVIYKMLKRGEKYYYMKEKLYNRKLTGWIRFLNHLKSMKEEDFAKWEHNIRMKYDLEYRPKMEKELRLNNFYKSA